MVEITKINGEPYSKNLEREIEGRGQAFLRDGRINSSQKPYEWDSTGDMVTLRFGRDDASGKGVSLPFQTNVTWVNNQTDYLGNPRLNAIKNLFFGELRDVSPQNLEEFLTFLRRDLEGFDLTREIHEKQTQGHNTKTGTGPITHRNERSKKRYTSNSEGIDSLGEDFMNVPGQEFIIDPASDIRLEERELKDGRSLFVASLSTEKFRGLSGVPKMKYWVGQRIKAKERKY